MLFCGSFFVIYVSCFFILVCSFQPCGHLLGKGWPLGSLALVIYCAFVTFPCGVLGQVWCLIVSIPGLAFFLTFNMEVRVLFGLILNVPQGPPRAIQSNLSVWHKDHPEQPFSLTQGLPRAIQSNLSVWHKDYHREFRVNLQFETRTTPVNSGQPFSLTQGLPQGIQGKLTVWNKDHPSKFKLNIQFDTRTTTGNSG